MNLKLHCTHGRDDPVRTRTVDVNDISPSTSVDDDFYTTRHIGQHVFPLSRSRWLLAL